MKKIVIVGGGTSGWLTASMLSKGLGEKFEIILISDENIGNIGVGEASLPCIRSVFNFLEIDTKDFMKNSNATFKGGIQFEGWNKEHFFWQPFYDYEENIKGDFWMRFWKCLVDTGKTDKKFDEFMSSTPYLGQTNKIYEVNYEKDAFHLDSGLFFLYLKEYCLKRGVKYINDNVCEFLLDDSGNIKKLSLRDNGEINDTDIIVDCTGFKSIILEGIALEEFISYSDQLLCDRAVVRKFKYDNSFKDRVPYTRSKALKAGWMWKIPLGDCIGVGYVHSSKHISIEEAREELMNEIELEPIVDFNTVYMRIGRHKNAYVKNIVGIGLSYGFIEPLESTGFMFVYSAVFKLLELLDNFYEKPEFEKEKIRFNESVGGNMDATKDFILYHYILNNLDTPFWIDSRNVLDNGNVKQILSLSDNINIPNNYKEKLCVGEFQRSFLGKLSYAYILAGMKKDYINYNSEFNELEKEKIDELIEFKNKYVQDSLNTGIDYNVFLKQYLGKN